MSISRRMLVRAALGTTSVATTFRARGYAAESVSLRQAAGQAGLHFGSVSDLEFRGAPPGYADLFIQNCDLLAAQTPWSKTGPRQFDPEPTWEDPNIVFARDHRMRLTGCHLLWQDSLPSWFEQLPSQSAAEQAIVRHIDITTRRYNPNIYSWNVVNEAIEPRDGRADSLKNTPLLRKLGPDFISTAFFTARQSAPNALLVYNDYGFEFPSAEQEARRTALLRLLDRLQSARAPIDAVGLQSHMRLDGPDFDARIYRNFLHEIAGRGLSIIISELDVLDVEFNPIIAARDADVAALYSAFLETALDERAVTAVITWGLVDQYSWLNLWHAPYFTRWDRQQARPLLFDNSFRPKPAFDAVLSALKQAPPRRHKG